MTTAFWIMNATGRITDSGKRIETACLCAQEAPSWVFDADGFAGCDRGELRRYARAGCFTCGGSGVEEVDVDPLDMHVHTTRAISLIDVMRLRTKSVHGYVAGCARFPDARRGIMGARARLAREVRARPESFRLPSNVTGLVSGARGETGVEEGPETVDELIERFTRYLDELARIIERGAQLGGDELAWG